MSEVVLLALIAVAGLAILLPMKGLLKDWQLVVLAPLVGQVLWVVAEILWLISPIHFTPRRVLFTLMWLAAFALALGMRRGNALRVVVITGATVATVAAVAAVVVATNPSTATNDSYWLITIGRAVGNVGFDAESNLIVLRSFPLFPALVQSGALLIRADYLVAAPAVFNIFGLTAIFGLLADDLKALGASRRMSVFVSALTIGALVTAVLVLFQVFYIRGNLEFGISLTLFVIAVWRWGVSGISRWSGLGFVMLIAATVLRVESPVLLLPYVGVLLLLPGKATKASLTLFASAYALVVAGLYGALIYQGEGVVLDDVSIAVIVVTALLMPAIPILGSRLRRVTPQHQMVLMRSIVPGLVLLAVIATVARPHWMLESGLNTFRALFVPTDGLWGGLWLFLAASAGLAWLAGNAPPLQALFATPVVVNLLTIYCLAYFTSNPWESGWAASQNRLLVAVLLPALYVVLLRIAPILNRASAGSADNLTGAG